MYFANPLQTVSTLSALLVCAYAAWRGGGTERWAAGLILVAWFATPWLQGPTAFNQTQAAVFATDGLLTLALIVIAVTSNRYWPMWVAAFQLLELLMHIDMSIDPHVNARAYYIGLEIWSYLILLALAVGTWIEAPKLIKGAHRF